MESLCRPARSWALLVLCVLAPAPSPAEAPPPSSTPRLQDTDWLHDGTLVPFSLGASPEQRLDVQPGPESPSRLRFLLDLEQRRNEALKREFRLCEEERNSSLHALAVLLGDERTEQLFSPVELKRLESGGLKVVIKRFRLVGLSAVLFILQTQDPIQPWILQTVQVARAESGEPLPFALYQWPTPPGPLGTRRVVVVMRTSPKDSREPTIVQLHGPCAARQLWYMSPHL